MNREIQELIFRLTIKSNLIEMSPNVLLPVVELLMVLLRLYLFY